MVKVTVVGASGYLGSELLRILINHPKVDEIIPVSRSLAGKPVSSLHRNLLGVCDTKFTDLNLEKIDSDIAFFAAPPGDWFAKLPQVLERGVKAITLGGKFRIKDAKVDKEVYGGYENSDLLSQRVYGLPEVYRKDIQKAKFVTNPGCYATSIILGLLPLADHKGELETDKVSVVAISGTSGAGAEPTQKMHHPEMSGNIRPYNTAFHRHTPEIESILNEKFKNLRISFVPIVGDFKRGILANSTVYAKAEKDCAGIYAKYYKNEPFVRVTTDLPEIADVVGSNFCDVHAEYSAASKRVLCISAIDNLVKGGSGQAVQNMNIMMKYDEKAGLGLLAGHP